MIVCFYLNTNISQPLGLKEIFFLFLKKKKKRKVNELIHLFSTFSVAIALWNSSQSPSNHLASVFKLTRIISQPLVLLEKAYKSVLLRWEDQLARASGSTAGSAGVSARLIRQKNKIQNKTKKTRKTTICSFIRKKIIGKENHNINNF